MKLRATDRESRHRRQTRNFMRRKGIRYVGYEPVGTYSTIKWVTVDIWRIFSTKKSRLAIDKENNI